MQDQTASNGTSVRKTASINLGDMIMSPIESSEYVTNRVELPTKAPDNTAVQQARLMLFDNSKTPALAPPDAAA